MTTSSTLAPSTPATSVTPAPMALETLTDLSPDTSVFQYALLVSPELIHPETQTHCALVIVRFPNGNHSLERVSWHAVNGTKSNVQFGRSTKVRQVDPNDPLTRLREVLDRAIHAKQKEGYQLQIHLASESALPDSSSESSLFTAATLVPMRPAHYLDVYADLTLPLYLQRSYHGTRLLYSVQDGFFTVSDDQRRPLPTELSERFGFQPAALPQEQHIESVVFDGVLVQGATTEASTYVLCDLYDPHQPELTFEARLDLLVRLVHPLKASGLLIALTARCESVEQIARYAQSYKLDGHSVILRDPVAPYLTSSTAALSSSVPLCKADLHFDTFVVQAFDPAALTLTLAPDRPLTNTVSNAEAPDLTTFPALLKGVSEGQLAWMTTPETGYVGRRVNACYHLTDQGQCLGAITSGLSHQP